jgi:hypothetical protein
MVLFILNRKLDHENSEKKNQYNLRSVSIFGISLTSLDFSFACNLGIAVGRAFDLFLEPTCSHFIVDEFDVIVVDMLFIKYFEFRIDSRKK